MFVLDARESGFAVIYESQNCFLFTFIIDQPLLSTSWLTIYEYLALEYLWHSVQCVTLPHILDPVHVKLCLLWLDLWAVQGEPLIGSSSLSRSYYPYSFIEVHSIFLVCLSLGCIQSLP